MVSRLKQSVEEMQASSLTVTDLSVDLRTETGWTSILDHVSFEVSAGQTLGLVGESGSGKTVSSLAIMGLLKFAGGRVTSGSVNVGGRDLLRTAEPELRKIRGGQIAMVFQEPRRSLDPAFTVGDQIAETIRAHRDISRRGAWQRAVAMLDRVGIASAERRAHDYPHTFSGGMCQRVMLAVALSTEPSYLIADEPTTALDVTVQAQILDLLTDLQAQMGLGMIFITHDLSVIAEMSDRVAVMYAGQIVEDGATETVFRSPAHPYTEALIAAIPQSRADSRTLRTLRGQVPTPRNMPVGCRFEPRCPYGVDICRLGPPELDVSRHGSRSKCVRVGELHLVGVSD